jgi:thiosulfate/3-mercaptopyruvate sulfurtransferase
MEVILMANKRRGIIAVYFSILSVSLFLFNLSAFGAQYANPQLLVSPEDIAKHAGKWIVLDCRDVKAVTDKKTGETLKGYADGHIPGAITLGGDCSKVLREKSNSTVFQDAQKYQEILGNAGISNTNTVVIYGDTPRITHATVGFWVLEYLGQKDVRFLNGGVKAWEAASKKLDTAETKRPPRHYTVHVVRSRIASTDEVMKIARGEVTGPQIVDARTGAEFAGTDVRAKRGGHIPHCVINVSEKELYDKATGKIKSMDDLENIFGKLDKNKRIIPHCQTGTRSTLTYLAFRLMGFKDPANYDDSWIVWGNREDTPIEK